MKRALVIVLLAAPSVAAEPAPEPPPRALVVNLDVAGVAVLAGGYVLLRLSSDHHCDECAGELGILMLAIGGMSYLGLAPLDHHERGSDARAWSSVALRLGLPAAAGLATYGVTHRAAPVVGAVGAAVVGAMIVDWAVLAPRAGPTVFGAPVSHGGVIGLAGTW